MVDFRKTVQRETCSGMFVDIVFVLANIILKTLVASNEKKFMLHSQVNPLEQLESVQENLTPQYGWTWERCWAAKTGQRLPVTCQLVVMLENEQVIPQPQLCNPREPWNLRLFLAADVTWPGSFSSSQAMSTLLSHTPPHLPCFLGTVTARAPGQVTALPQLYWRHQALAASPALWFPGLAHPTRALGMVWGPGYCQAPRGEDSQGPCWSHLVQSKNIPVPGTVFEMQTKLEL